MAPDRPSDGQRGERSPGPRRDRQEARAEPRGEQHRRMPERQAEGAADKRSQSGRRTVETACAAMPSPRPVKPSLSVVVALTLTRVVATSRIAATLSVIAAR